MATKTSSSKLLSKIAKFVRHPNIDWRDLDKIEREPANAPEPMPAHNRQTLKDMIERKRHEDAIRKHEFDQLRHLRRETPVATNEPSEESTLIGSTAGPSDLDDRASTIRKIDEIEVQMSKQWWKAQSLPHQDAAPPPVAHAPVELLTEGAESFFASTQLKTGLIDFDDIPTSLGPATSAQFGEPEGKSSDIADWQRQPIDSKGFDSSKLFAAEMADNLADPDLEDAAVRFANGDEAGTEAVLLSALRSQSALSAVAQARAEALFDLYRSLGQQTNFEREALNYAQQFGCSAPVWRHPEGASGSVQAVVMQTIAWRCPAHLEPLALAQLPSHLPPGNSLSLDWSALVLISEPAARDLATLLAAWSQQQGALYFKGQQVLDKLLRAATPRGVRQTAQFWWTARMDQLRILQLQDDFEMAAFDYCVTYEAAPSPWRAASCELLQQPPVAEPSDQWLTDSWPQHADLRAAATPPLISMPGADAPASGPVRLTLAGELLGDGIQGLPPLDAASQQGQQLTIDCSQLIRVDFSAAGSILNWVAQGQAQGCQIEFRDVPPLVASFFNLIGINQHAHVITRTH
ncbi:STAS domain-containing protein [Rhodoferax sp.]|uniref:STAS domain-containing protein n=1 Tax=Rhodoferax sp. TaxID=50421 RepID=UPI00261E667A|nr:STAS domain-containing protein [Rhodoferax sp.]MDD2918900.1 STAS domain-containing protein [Rhodoferax sp.]